MTPAAKDNDKVFFPEFGDDLNNNNYIPPIPPKKSMSSNDGDYDAYDSNDGTNNNTPIPRISKNVNHISINLEKQHSMVDVDKRSSLTYSKAKEIDNLAPKTVLSDESANESDALGALDMDNQQMLAMRQHFEDLVHSEAQARGMSISVPQHQHMQAQFGNDPEQSKMIDLFHQQSLRNAMSHMGLQQMRQDSAPEDHHKIQQAMSNANRELHETMSNSSLPMPQMPQMNQRQPHQHPITPQPRRINSHGAHGHSAAYTDISTPTPKHQEPMISPANSQQALSAKYASPVPTMPQPQHPQMPRQSISYHQVQNSQHAQQQQQSMHPQHQQMVSQSVPNPVPIPRQPSGPSQVQQVQPQLEQQSINAAVQKLYEQQQTLLEKLQLLEKDDPDPQSAKVEYEYDKQYMIMRSSLIWSAFLRVNYDCPWTVVEMCLYCRCVMLYYVYHILYSYGA